MIRIGLERLPQHAPDAMRGTRLGLLMNQASVDRRLRSACDIIAESFPGQLTALFAPQHGLWGRQQANMIQSPHEVHPRLKIPVYSLYSETRTPTPQMLEAIDCLVVDLQDVGTRVYTFIWTVSHCLEACAAAGIPVVVLDRPNPLGGEQVEGPMLQAGYESFVGRAAIPLRHGLMIGEAVRLVNDVLDVRADLHVVPMDTASRDWSWERLGRSWVWPSPNLPRLESVRVYPGTVMLEGTNLSEGRGTTLPFEVLGAPYVDPFALADRLSEYALPGVTPLPLYFVPTFDKWKGESCGGLLLSVDDPIAFRPVLTATAVLASVRSLWPDCFEWLPPPYEYETVKPPIDIIAGTARLRERIDAIPAGGRMSAAELNEIVGMDAAAWSELCRPFLLY